jgi:GNAT superfamily N-acetyltransferase
MTIAPSFTTEPARPEHGAAIAALFAREGCACHCRWWHFEGDKNAWLGRIAHAPEQNRAEMLAALESGSDEMRGVVALSADRAIGWMKIAPAPALAKLYAQKPYRGLSCFGGDRAGVFTIGCFLVDPEWRRRGVSRALVAAGLDLARQAGARAVEAFPRSGEPVSQELLWTGPPDVFLAAGFELVDATGPYPVLRRSLW